MYLSDLFEQLSYGELSQLNIGGSEGQGIEPHDYHQVIPHVNMALIELHKRFPLIEKQFLIRTYEDILEYKIHSDYSITAGSEDIKYLEDSVDNPFDDRIVKIQSIVDSDNVPFNLSDTAGKRNLKILGFNKIKANSDFLLENEIMYVNTQHSLPSIVLTDLDPTTQEIDIPLSLLEPLTYFTLHRLYAALSTSSDTDKMAQYGAKYDQACNRVIEQGLLDVDLQNSKLENNGWK